LVYSKFILFDYVRSDKLIDTFLNPFLESTSIEKLSVKILAHRNKVLPLTEIEPKRLVIIR
jgi:hypothetical protein